MGLFCIGACSGRRLPPGTPPPEYEPPLVAPWSADAPDAGAPVQEQSVDDASAGGASLPPSELSLDAGVR